METGKKPSGVSVSELGFVLLLMGILAVIVIPKFIDLASTATQTSIAAMEANVKSTFAITLAETSGVYPDLQKLASNVRQGHLQADGIVFKINTENYIVNTYTNQACTLPTKKPDNIVRCIGNIRKLSV